VCVLVECVYALCVCYPVPVCVCVDMATLQATRVGEGLVESIGRRGRGLVSEGGVCVCMAVLFLCVCVCVCVCVCSVCA